MRAFRGCFCLVLFLALQACGDDDSGGPGQPTGIADGGITDASTHPDGGTTKPPAHHRDASAGTGGATADAGSDSGPGNTDFDAAVNNKPPPPAVAGPPPKAWSCPDALWADGHCDCGCSATDWDCKQFSCIDPGCIEGACEACFTLSGSWKPCAADPKMDDWTCDALAIADSLCDCGCGIPDPACKGSGCETPGCRKQSCDVRHNCSDTMIAANDDCSSNNPQVLITGTSWICPWDRYASGDGCDCGCGAIDPDCGDGAGCSMGRCFNDACVRCSEEGRPYDCDAAKAGWDEDILGDSSSSEPSQCNALHFGTGDGCDCGCGGPDPDCGKDKGCEGAGCKDNACDRCTDISGKPTGCLPSDVATTWTDDSGCNADNYGTGDGCDCGCGIPDPDCDGLGSIDSTFVDTCDVCHDKVNGSNTNYYVVPCPKWTCGSATDVAFANAECDCGCGVIDPFCRDVQRESCTKAGCEIATCQFCNDSGGRAACGGQWRTDTDVSCHWQFYGEDGLCDCGCGAHDPDCKKGQDCTDKGCNAPDCDVCHDGSLLDLCYAWTCSADSFGKGDGCDCGCGARDPDCNGNGCQEPGCKDDACEVCHDPFGRAVPCP